MLSDDMRSLARALAQTGKECAAETATITLLQAGNVCTSIALHFLSLANRAQTMELAAIPPEKRGLTIINGGKSSCIKRNREP